MSFALSAYLNSSFEYVIFSSVVVIGGAIREHILSDITAKDYETIVFTLKCSEEALTQRHRKRGDTNEISYQWLRMESCPGDIVIDTDQKSIAQIVDDMRDIIAKLPDNR